MAGSVIILDKWKTIDGEVWMKKLLLAGMLLLLTGCGPEVGSKDWCTDMKKKNKGDWTLEESKNFAKHCLFK